MELITDTLQMLTAEEERPHGSDPAMCFPFTCWSSAEAEIDGGRQDAALATASHA